jgi:uncharacterized protein YktB (UPF0637 family)
MDKNCFTFDVLFWRNGLFVILNTLDSNTEAKTTAEKLAMKGEKADINNISKAVKEEAEHLKKAHGKIRRGI